MNEKLTALFQKIAESEDLQAKFAEFGTLEEAYEFARTLQDGFTKEEFVEVCKAAAEAATGDISDEELVAAAGGTDDPLSLSLKSVTGKTNTRTVITGGGPVITVSCRPPMTGKGK